MLHIEDAILHRALHGPRAAPAVSARLWDSGRQRHRNVTAAEATAWGRQTSFSQRLPLFGVWDEGQRLGHRRCPSALPLAAGQRGRTHAARAGEALRGPPDASAVRPAQRHQGSFGGNRNSHELRMHGTRYGGKAGGLWGAAFKTLDTPLGRGSSPRSFLVLLGAATCLLSTSRQRAAVVGCCSTAPHTS